VTLGAGVALGASAMYLLDPDHGPARRREARRTALREAARRGTHLGVRGIERLGSVTEAAVYGYHAGRGQRAVEDARAGAARPLTRPLRR
jgi:hypothetical protein